MGSELDSVGDLAASGIISLSTGPFGSALHKHDYRESGRPVVPAEAISDGDLDSSKLNYIDETKAEELTRYFLEPGDLVFARRGAQACGHSAYVGQDHHGAVAGTGLLYARVLKKDVLDPLYFFLVMSSAESVRWLKTHAIGATMPNLNTGIISSTPFRLIALEEQHEIISNYVPLRKKLSLLAKMNATLERMSQALFKSWFVDFDPVIDNALAAGNPIPDELAPRAEVRRKALTSGTTQQGLVDHPTLSNPKSLFPAAFEFNDELGWIPEAWDVSAIGSKLETVLGGTPSRKNANYWQDGTVGWINSGKVNEFRVTEPSELITEEALAKSATKLLPKRTTVLAITGATLGQVSLTEIECCANQSVIGILGTEQLPSEYIYSWINQIIDKLVASQTGGAQQHINKGNVQEANILLPNSEVLNEFIDQVRPAFDQIALSCFESESLTKLRDTLLPKLISGELRMASSGQLNTEAKA